MIGYVTLGTNDFERAAAFYDELLAVIGGTRAMDSDSVIGWANGSAGGLLSIIKPFDQQPATIGNGVMAAIQVTEQIDVDRLHAKAIELGAADEGAPGRRGEGFYAGYFRDLDGNKLNAYFMG